MSGGAKHRWVTERYIGHPKTEILVQVMKAIQVVAQVTEYRELGREKDYGLLLSWLLYGSKGTIKGHYYYFKEK